ncbi:MAG: HEAT repeat domain-containing protein [Planctomycetales bacterium]|nr:HEAT repeat domain-containing protein [Planctomycetales bacterium]
MSRLTPELRIESVRHEEMDVLELVELLRDREPAVRMKARKHLAHRKDPESVPALVRALADSKTHTRWEAAKTLGEICHPESALALTEAMNDEQADVRWVAAEAVAKLGRDGAMALLEALIRNAKSDAFREAAHHSIVRMAEHGETLAPVRHALERHLPAVEAPSAAFAALNALAAG